MKSNEYLEKQEIFKLDVEREICWSYNRVKPRFMILEDEATSQPMYAPDLLPVLSLLDHTEMGTERPVENWYDVPQPERTGAGTYESLPAEIRCKIMKHLFAQNEPTIVLFESDDENFSYARPRIPRRRRVPKYEIVITRAQYQPGCPEKFRRTVWIQFPSIIAKLFVTRQFLEDALPYFAANVKIRLEGCSMNDVFEALKSPFTDPFLLEVMNPIFRQVTEMEALVLSNERVTSEMPHFKYRLSNLKYLKISLQTQTGLVVLDKSPIQFDRDTRHVICKKDYSPDLHTRVGRWSDIPRFGPQNAATRNMLERTRSWIATESTVLLAKELATFCERFDINCRITDALVDLETAEEPDSAMSQRQWLHYVPKDEWLGRTELPLRDKENWATKLNGMALVRRTLGY